MTSTIVQAHVCSEPDIVEVVDRVHHPDGIQTVTYTYHLTYCEFLFAWREMDGIVPRVAEVLAQVGLSGTTSPVDHRWWAISGGRNNRLHHGYLVINGLDLTPFGNRIPNVRVKLTDEGGEPIVIHTTRAYMRTYRAIDL